MILFLEFIFTHAFILFMYAFFGVLEWHCTYILPLTSNSEEVAESPSSVVAEVPATEPVVVASNAVIDYEASQLTEEQQAFFDSFLADVSVNFVEEGIATEVDEDDLLLMNTWESSVPEVHISNDLSSKSNAQIKDLMLGVQTWIVEVIGEEQYHIHVSDGTGRAWINAEKFNAFTKGDILSVLVDRKTEFEIELSNAEILQSHSNDFSLAEDIFTDDDFDIKVIGA